MMLHHAQSCINYSILCIVISGEEFVCLSRGGCSAVFISLSEETAELVLRWKENGMQNFNVQ